jgi:polyisoprenoid-binding protein YceI
MKWICTALFPVVFAGVLFAVDWKADASKAKVDFHIKSALGMVHGHFTGLKSTIRFDEHDLAGSSIVASIDPKSVATGIGLRNHHVREEEQFLDVSKHPEISFRSTKIIKSDNGFNADGELTLKGVTKPIQIAFTFSPNGNNAAVFKGQFTIKRLDYNIGKPGGSVGETITIDLEVPVTK